MKIIGFGYKSRSGKDTAAKLLASTCRLNGITNVRWVPFARKLKQVAEDLFGMYGLRSEEFYNSDEGSKLRDVPLGEINKTPVELWIAFGDTLKKATYEPLWRDYVFRRADCEVLIISDFRYPAEVDEALARGGKVFRVDRSSSVTKDSDSYLDGYDKWTGVIDNHTDSLCDLSVKIENLFYQYVREQ